METSIVSNVLNKFLGTDFLDQWIDFIDNNSMSFIEESANGCDFTHQQYAIYKGFSDLVEEQLSECCDKFNISSIEFYHICNSQFLPY